MKAIVLGGCGFIGSHVVDALLAANYDVRVFDLRPERFRPPCQGVEYIFGDFSKRAILVEALSTVDTVFHLIGTTFPSTANINPQADVKDNLINSLGLMRTMIDLGVERVLYLSSGGTVYGIPESSPVPEDHPLRPVNSYGIVKVAIESYFEMYLRQGKLRPVIIRAANPYGPRQSHIGVQGAVATFMKFARDGKPIEIWGDGSVTRDYFHVKDLAHLCVKAIESDSVGAFNAGSGKGVSLAQLVDAISLATEKKIERIYQPVRALEIHCSVLDVSRAYETFGWKAGIGLQQGLKDYWRWLEEQT